MGKISAKARGNWVKQYPNGIISRVFKAQFMENDFQKGNSFFLMNLFKSWSICILLAKIQRGSKPFSGLTRCSTAIKIVKELCIRPGHRDLRKKLLLFFRSNPEGSWVLPKSVTRALYDKNETCPRPSEDGPFIGVIYVVKMSFFAKKVSSNFFHFLMS